MKKNHNNIKKKLLQMFQIISPNFYHLDRKLKEINWSISKLGLNFLFNVINKKYIFISFGWKQSPWKPWWRSHDTTSIVLDLKVNHFEILKKTISLGLNCDQVYFKLEHIFKRFDDLKTKKPSNLFRALSTSKSWGTFYQLHRDGKFKLTGFF